MTGPRVRATLAIALLVAPLAVLAAACSRPPEQQLLTQFFRAARARDNNTLAMMSAAEFTPQQHGTVESFDITTVGGEQRSPLDLKPLIDAENAAKAAQAEFTKKKFEYQQANLSVIEEVIKLERTTGAKMNPAQTKVKAEWDKWREDTTTHTRAVAGARQAIDNATATAEASLTQPGRPPFTIDKFQGDLISKDVTLSAEVRSPDGQTSQKTLVVTFQRVAGTLDGQQRDGRWIITRIQGA